ncbi:hypothetical protein HUU62_04385 [Rhodoferax sp. 4810]|nr:hypothetical protein [Rhodoferax jenense]
MKITQNVLIAATLAAAVYITAKANRKPGLSSTNASTGATGESIYSLAGMLPTADPWYSMTSLSRQLANAQISNTDYLAAKGWEIGTLTS